MNFESAIPDGDHLAWFKSSYSGNQGNCVEVAECATVVHVRDSKDVAGPQLQFSPRGWSTFVDFARS